MAIAPIPVHVQHPKACLLGQGLVQFLADGAINHLLVVVHVPEQIGAVEDGHGGHKLPRAAGRIHCALHGSHPGLFQHVIVLAELRGREMLDLDPSFRPLLHQFGPLGNALFGRRSHLIMRAEFHHDFLSLRQSIAGQQPYRHCQCRQDCPHRQKLVPHDFSSLFHFFSVNTALDETIWRFNNHHYFLLPVGARYVFHPSPFNSFRKKVLSLQALKI